MPFVGKNFFRGIVINDGLPFGKDAAYEMLKGCSSNWQCLLLLLGVRLYEFINRLTDETRESVLKGFRMLTVCWSDGASCLPMDFALLSSADAKNRHCESHKSMDRRCCAWQRRKKATVKATKHLDEMVKRILSAGVQAKYLLMDSWFTMPATVTALSTHIDVIGMVKKTPNVLYGYNLISRKNYTYAMPGSWTGVSEIIHFATLIYLNNSELHVVSL